MPALKASEVGRFVRRRDLSGGVFLIYGPDGGLVRETAQVLIASFAEGPEGGDPITLEGSELDADPGRLAVEARTGSLFGGRRILRVRGAGKGIVGVLKDLLADPADAAIILEAGNLPPRDPLRLVVEAAPAGLALPCYADSARTLDDLIRESFGKAGIAADSETLAMLREQLGGDREITRREIEKLTLYALESKRLSASDVAALTADGAAVAIDEILDATGSGDVERLDRALTRAFGAAVDPQRLLAVAGQHVAALRLWRAEVDGGRPARQVLETARPKPHFSRLGALEQQLRLWDDPALAAAEARLLNATAETRRRPALAQATLRRTLLALATSAVSR